MKKIVKQNIKKVPATPSSQEDMEVINRRRLCIAILRLTKEHLANENNPQS